MRRGRPESVKLLGGLIALTALILAWYWFSWKLSLVLYLAFLGNNNERDL
jgi:hypothetical protein